MKTFLKKMGFLLVTLTLASLLAIPTFAANRAVTVNLHAKQGETVTINAGDTNKLGKKQTIVVTATWDGEKLNPKKVKWSSSNKSVAKVSKTGVITVKKGAKVKKSATITAKFKFQKKWYKSKIKVKITGTGKKNSKKNKKSTSKKKNKNWKTMEAVILNRESGLNFAEDDQIFVYLPGLLIYDPKYEFESEIKVEPSCYNNGSSGLALGDHVNIWDTVAPKYVTDKWTANLTANPKEMIIIEHKGVTGVNKYDGCIQAAFGRKDYYLVDSYNKLKWHISYNYVSCRPYLEAAIKELLRKYLGTDNVDAIRAQYTAKEAADRIKAGADNETNLREAYCDQKRWQNHELISWFQGKSYVNYEQLYYYIGISNVNATVANCRYGTTNTSNASWGTPGRNMMYWDYETHPHIMQ